MSLSDELPKGHRRGATARQRLAGAYQAMFVNANPTKADARIVFADLAKESGFFSVTSPGTPNETLQRAEGGRAVFARIWNRLHMTADEKRWLAEEGRNEVFVSIEENCDIP